VGVSPPSANPPATGALENAIDGTSYTNPVVVEDAIAKPQVQDKRPLKSPTSSLSRVSPPSNTSAGSGGNAIPPITGDTGPSIKSTAVAQALSEARLTAIKARWKGFKNKFTSDTFWGGHSTIYAWAKSKSGPIPENTALTFLSVNLQDGRCSVERQDSPKTNQQAFVFFSGSHFEPIGRTAGGTLSAEGEMIGSWVTLFPAPPQATTELDWAIQDHELAAAMVACLRRALPAMENKEAKQRANATVELLDSDNKLTVAKNNVNGPCFFRCLQFIFKGWTIDRQKGSLIEAVEADQSGALMESVLMEFRPSSFAPPRKPRSAKSAKAESAASGSVAPSENESEDPDWVLIKPRRMRKQSDDIQEPAKIAKSVIWGLKRLCKLMQSSNSDRDAIGEGEPPGWFSSCGSPFFT
jgi:hypothetical protein